MRKSLKLNCPQAEQISMELKDMEKYNNQDRAELKNPGSRFKKKTALCGVTALLISVLSLTACGSGTADKYALRDEAVELFQSGDYAGAEAKFDEALQASEGEVSKLQYDILKYKAECMLRQGDTAGAKKSYEALLELEKDTENEETYKDILSELGNLDIIEDGIELMEAGSYDEAAELFEGLASLDESLTGSIAWFNLAVCMEYNGNFERANVLWQQYVEANPDDEAALKELRFCGTRI